MGKILLLIIFVVTLLVSACGNTQQSKQAPSDNAAKPAQEKTAVDLSGTPKQSWEKLQELKQISKQTYWQADFNTRMVEQKEREQVLWQSFRLQTEQQAEANIAVRKQELEDAYQLKLFNLRVQLESLRMRSKERAKVENEIAAVRREREAKLLALQQEKQAYVDEQMRLYEADMQQRLNVKAAELQCR